MTNLKEEEQVPLANLAMQYIESNFQKIGLETKGYQRVYTGIRS